MTNQLQGELLFKGLDPSTDQWVYTPWITVRGDLATYGVEVTAVNGTQVTWNVETRTAEDPVTIGELFTLDQTANTVNVHYATPSVKAMQQIRYKLATESGADPDLAYQYSMKCASSGTLECDIPDVGEGRRPQRKLYRPKDVFSRFRSGGQGKYFDDTKLPVGDALSGDFHCWFA